MASALKVVLLVVVATVAFSEAGLPPRFLRERLLYPTKITTACGVTLTSGKGADTPTPAADGQATLFYLRCRGGCKINRDREAGTKTISGGRRGEARFICRGANMVITDQMGSMTKSKYSFRNLDNMARVRCGTTGKVLPTFYCTPKDQ